MPVQVWNKKLLANNKIIAYCIKFIAIYCLLYYGSQAIIGLCAAPGYYSAFIDQYFNYPALLRNLLMNTSKSVLDLLDYQTEIESAYKIKFVNGRGVKIVYSCLGIGLFSFWTAFVLANEGGLKKKLIFIAGGVLLIFMLNVARIVLLLLAANKKMAAGFIKDHHTVFNIAAYIVIFIMIIIFDRSEKKKPALQVKKDKAVDG